MDPTKVQSIFLLQASRSLKNAHYFYGLSKFLENILHDFAQSRRLLTAKKGTEVQIVSSDILESSDILSPLILLLCKQTHQMQH